MFSVSVPIGGVIALTAVALIAFSAKSASSTRLRNGLAVLAVSGVAAAGFGYVRVARDDNRDHEALLNERRHLCQRVATTIGYHQDRFLNGSVTPPWNELKAALRALESEVSATWYMCVEEESKCGSMNPTTVIDGSGERLDVVRQCFEGGPARLDSARRAGKD